MNHPKSLNLTLWSGGMCAVLAAQFLSALADNAVLIAAIAIVKNKGMSHLVPFLQEAFVAPFILLAPFVGQIADGFPKGRVMLWANLLKLAGAIAMMAGLDPLLAYGLIGIGATIYSPAKYGILSQMFDADRIVGANGMLEGSTIVAILLGVLLGGWLTDHSMVWAFAGIVAAYALAAAANLLIPRLSAEHLHANFALLPLILSFGASLKKLFADADARFSLLGTATFWASGTTLRLLLFAWVPVALGMTNNQAPANLMGVLSIGIVLGAAVASAWISLTTVNRALVGGLLLGPIILTLSTVTDFRTAALLMGATGLCGGVFVVPLNALLQERGHQSIGAGNALAVQNFVENSMMLLFVGGYSLAAASDVPVTQTVRGFGGVLLAAVTVIAIVRYYRRSTAL